MDKQLIKNIILEWQRESLNAVLLKRKHHFDIHVNYVLVGVRRAGKSSLLYQDIQQNVNERVVPANGFLYINFEDERLADLTVEDLGVLLDCYYELFENKKPFVYLDEIQQVDGWEKFVRRLADQKYRVMVTGSNAKMLSSEIAGVLGGRFISREIFPFSFLEYLQYHQVELFNNWYYDSTVRSRIFRYFEDYFQYGGFAETFSQSNKREWLNSLYQKILIGDVVIRNKIRSPRVLRLLARKIAESVLQPVSQNRLMHIIKASGDSISYPVLHDYLDYMEEAYVIFSIPNLNSPLTEQTTTMKRYFIDNGILNLFYVDGKTKLLENLVASHLNSLYRNTQEDTRLYYYNKNVEIDFCIPENKTAIQVCHSLSDDETYRREVSAMRSFLRAYPEYHGIILTYNDERTIEEESFLIEVIPVWRWILNS
ncbi:MAG: ATP-binding protein [Bacteroidales bacterium]|nr:ATP-binding protein [Bacteroidales bacterium]